MCLAAPERGKLCVCVCVCVCVYDRECHMSMPLMPKAAWTK